MLSKNNLIDELEIKNIDIIKIDIEASEYDLFSKDYEIQLSKVNWIIIELHEYISSGCRKCFFFAI